MSYQNILFERADSIARITLNRPDSRNALNDELADELLDAVVRCSYDQETRAVLLTGSGKIFCSGGDIRGMAEAIRGNAPVSIGHLVATMNDLVTAITRMPKPLVVAVNGPAVGAGFALVLASDIAIAAENAKFVVGFSAVALSPDSGTTFFLPRYVGLKQAIELVLTNRQLSAHEALNLGIVNEVVAEADFAARVDELLHQLASGPTLAFGRAKRLLHRGIAEPLETQLEDERAMVVDSCQTEDFREAVRAFLEKTKPIFKGR